MTSPAATLTRRELDSRGPDVAADERTVLREEVERHLAAQGFALNNGRILAPIPDNKQSIRALHSEAVTSLRDRARGTLMRHESEFIRHLAHGDDIDVANIHPSLKLISDRRSYDAALWRWCALHWSIPVSSGYGRRLRFLVLDQAHQDKVIGLIGLADPVFSMRSRDEWIGWDKAVRSSALVHVMDAFVLGAVPPFNSLRGGKLVALLAGSTEVRRIFRQRYGHRDTLISRRDPNADLVLLTTTSALGRSSVYNRLRRPDGSLAFISVGYTLGSGDFHLSGAIYDQLAEYAKRHGLGERTQRHQRWPGYESGSPRNRRAVLDCALSGIGFNPKSLRIHGIQREVFVSPLAANSAAYLCGEDQEAEWQDLSVAELSEWWKNRWAIPRARRDDRWRDFYPREWRLWSS